MMVSSVAGAGLGNRKGQHTIGADLKDNEDFRG